MLRSVRVLLIVWVLFVGLTGNAVAARWDKKALEVYDFTPKAMRPLVRAVVDDYNATMPATVPRLKYVSASWERACEDLPEFGRKGAISVCQRTRPMANVGDSAILIYGTTIDSVLIRLSPDAPEWDISRILCHEMGHALYDAPDADTYPEGTDSCVRNNQSTVGSWDIAYAKQVYATRSKHDPRGHGSPRHRRGSRHRASHGVGRS